MEQKQTLSRKNNIKETLKSSTVRLGDEDVGHVKGRGRIKILYSSKDKCRREKVSEEPVTYVQLWTACDLTSLGYTEVQMIP